MRGLAAIILVTTCWWNVNAGQQRGLKVHLVLVSYSYIHPHYYLHKFYHTHSCLHQLQADDSILSFGQNSDVKLYRGKGEKNKGTRVKHLN